MASGSQCARFEVRTVDGREDIYNLLLLVCYKGGALWDIIPQYTSILLLDRLLLKLFFYLTISQRGSTIVGNVRSFYLGSAMHTYATHNQCSLIIIIINKLNETVVCTDN